MGNLLERNTALKIGLENNGHDSGFCSTLCPNTSITWGIKKLNLFV